MPDREDIFDIVDSSDRVVGRAPRSEVHSKGLLHRASHVLMFKGRGDARSILLQRRSETKDSYPGIYTTSCSGHVDSGESYSEAAVREMAEETGLRVDASRLSKIGKVGACSETGNEFTCVYAMECDGSEIFSPPPDEVASLEWVKVSDFEKAASENPAEFTPSFLCVYRFYLSKAFGGV